MPPPSVPPFVPRDIPGPGTRPRWFRRSVSAIRDFPPGCGPSSSSSRPPVPLIAPSGTSSLIPYLVHRAVNTSFIREQSPRLAAQLDQAVKPPEFKGEVDPVAANIWLKEMEKAFVLTKVSEELKTDYASYFWKNDSNYWWESTRALEGEGHILWARFTELFLEKYFPDYLQSQMEMEFLELKQEDRSVTEYEANFTELGRIAPEYVIVQPALVIKSDQRLAAKEQGEKKRKFESGPARPSTTLVNSTPTRVSRPMIDCKTCEKKHNGQYRENINYFKCGQKGHYSTECKSETQGVTCFSCGKVGHIARNFNSVTQGNVGRSVSQGPSTSTARARTFKMTKKSPSHDSDVVVGTLSLNSVPVNILFDSGVSKSFIYVNCVNKMQLMLEDLEEPLTIEVVSKEKVLVSQFCPKCSIEISGYTFPADIIPFELGDFDVILGMYWLSLYKANIDCKKKRVVMYTPDNKRISYQGQSQDKKFLSIMQAKKLLRQGCEAYLAHVVDTKKETPILDKIPIIREFLDVFPEELPGLPPDQEIEFSIDLIHGAEPVSKAPYMMAPMEMKELAKQLQELLDKGFIRPSVSPWGAPVLFIKKKDMRMRLCID
ncbi:hypothetical protein AgCh_022076 [Apium graveolens]